MVGWRCCSSALDRGECSASCRSHFTPWRKSSHCPLGKLGGPQELVWILWRTENLAPARNRTPASLYTEEGNADYLNAKTSSTYGNHHALGSLAPCISDHSTTIRRLVVPGPFYQHPGSQCLPYYQLNYYSSFVS